MKQLLSSLISFLHSLSGVDIVFFSAIIVLIILAVTMIYVIRLNVEEEEEKMTPASDEPDDLIDLVAITKAIESGEPARIDLTDYEEEQESKAIISYDELIKNHNTVKLNYKEEKEIGDVLVKEVDLDHLTSASGTSHEDIKVTSISYEKEEAFLETLKKMQELLS